MATASFDLLVPNLLVGLTKGARVMGDHGRRFRELGYRVFRIEPSFLLNKGGRCNPDMVLSSEKTNSTLVVEWTNAVSVHDDKKDQFRRYARITSGDIIHGLAVPRLEATVFDVAIVVSTDAVASFKQFLTHDHLSLVLFEFAAKDQEFKLRKVTGTLKEKDTERFFSKVLMVDRIPLRYVPFALGRIAPEELVTHVVTHVLSLITRGSTQFSIEEFCSGFVSVWNTIGQEKRGEISRVTKDVLGALARSPVGSELLLRQQDSPNPPRWDLLLSEAKRTQVRALHKRLNDFILQVKHQPFQLELLGDVSSFEVRYARPKSDESSSTDT